MSGLIGYLGPAGQPLEVARAMGESMCHAPRRRCELAAAGSHGAMGRISIGIFNRTAQPERAAGGLLQLWFCGELYHQEERRAELGRLGLLQPGDGDAALALQMFLREGATGLARLEGAFVAAVWDDRERTLTIVNDRFGLYPHYYCLSGATFAFAPEIKALLAAPGVPCRLDLTAVAEYTQLQQLLGDRTWCEEIRQLPPATILRYSQENGRLLLARYWGWEYIRPQPVMSFEEAVEETTHRFQRAIDAMTQPPHRLGVYLSGGLDGRTILGFVRPEIALAAITYGAAGCRDVVYAGRLARRAGRPHHWFPLADGSWVLEHADAHLALTEGMHGWMHAHGMSTLAEASALIDVNLSGWDGGTTLGGRLDTYENDPFLRHAPDEATFADRLFTAFRRDLTWPGLTDAEAEALFSPPGCAGLSGLARDSFAAHLARTAHYPLPYRADFFYIDQHVLRSTQAMIVFQRSAMEVRCPFFDYSFLEFIYGLPERFLAGPDLHRAVLTRRSPGLALVPSELDDRLPHSSQLVRGVHGAAQRAKHAANRYSTRLAGPLFPERPRLYADYETYLRTDLRQWAETILFDERTQARMLWNPAAVRALWDRHLRGDELWTIGKIAPLITIELVLRALLDKHSVAAQTPTH